MIPTFVIAFASFLAMMCHHAMGEDSSHEEGPLDYAAGETAIGEAVISLEAHVHRMDEKLYLDVIVRNRGDMGIGLADPFISRHWPRFYGFRYGSPTLGDGLFPFPQGDLSSGASSINLGLAPGGFCGRRFRVLIHPPVNKSQALGEVELHIQAVGFDGFASKPQREERRPFVGPKLSGEIVVRSNAVSLGKYPIGSRYSIVRQNLRSIRNADPQLNDIRHFLRGEPIITVGDTSSVDLLACNYSPFSMPIYDPQMASYGVAPSPFQVNVHDSDACLVLAKHNGMERSLSEERHHPESITLLPPDAICGRAMPWLFQDRAGDYTLSVRIRSGVFADAERVLKGPPLDLDLASDHVIQHRYKVIEAK